MHPVTYWALRARLLAAQHAECAEHRTTPIESELGAGTAPDTLRLIGS